jgi:hypothetical protein
MFLFKIRAPNRVNCAVFVRVGKLMNHQHGAWIGMDSNAPFWVKTHARRVKTHNAAMRVSAQQSRF